MWKNLSQFLLSIIIASIPLAFFPIVSSANQIPKEFTIKVEDVEKKISDKILTDWFYLKSNFHFDESYLSEIENPKFCPFDKIVCNFFYKTQDRFHLKQTVSNEISTEKVSLFLQELKKEIDIDPVDAKFKIENGRATTFVKEQEGKELNVEKSIDVIVQALNQNLNSAVLVYNSIEPTVTTKDVNNIGINKMIGFGKTDFVGSTNSRIHNIKVALKRFNGKILKPGEEFSFVEILGPVDGEHGYLPELVIKNNKTEPEFGGGICQVSSTVFKAAIYAGLEITERRNHAYPIKYYYPYGMDATIYIPKPDLRFVNNTPNHILLQSRIEGTELYIEFYGTDDGRKIEIDGPHITQKNPDGSMKTTFTQLVTAKDGSVLINDTFNSNYDSPDKYPHPTNDVLTSKPSEWSKSEWKEYKKAHGI